MKSLHPDDLGTFLTVETCPKIKIDDLIKQCRDSFKESMIASQLKVMDVDVELIVSTTKFNGIRFWFKCPQCGKRVGILFKHPITQTIGCRTCLNLSYRKQRYKGMVEGL